MMIQISDPRAMGALSEFMRARVDAVVEQVTPNGLAISLLGSYSNTAMAKEIGSALRQWKSGPLTAGCRVELNP